MSVVASSDDDMDVNNVVDDLKNSE